MTSLTIIQTVNQIIHECRNQFKRNILVGPIGCKYDTLGVVQEIRIQLCWKLFMHKSESVLANDTDKIIWDLRYKQIAKSLQKDWAKD